MPREMQPITILYNRCIQWSKSAKQWNSDSCACDVRVSQRFSPLLSQLRYDSRDSVSINQSD
ncbi:hypothetical protein B0H12DRAFT_1121625, partial [Mycena haematopus]